MNNETVFLTPAELSKRWNNAVTVGTLANWRNQGKGPTFQKIGSRVRYQLEHVVAYEAANVVANDNQKAGGVVNG
jgi:hypothetical protein